MPFVQAHIPPPLICPIWGSQRTVFLLVFVASQVKLKEELPPPLEYVAILWARKGHLTRVGREGAPL